MNRTPSTLILCLALASLGCANYSSDYHSPTDLGRIVEGPGATFDTVEDAATDALAWSYLRSRHDQGNARVRGGAILPAAGGFTYERVYAASRHDPTLVIFPLAADAVAHFRHYPRRGRRSVDSVNETHSSADLRVVDETDPLHRPSYLLTPSLRVRVYAGHQVADVSNLKSWGRARSRLALR